MFPKLDEIKEAVNETLAKPRYNVEELYHENGIWQYLARSTYFTTTALLVIVANTIWIGIDTDLNKATILCDAPVVFQVADNVFCSWFCFELTVRFMAFRVKRHAFQDAWFIFDSLLVFFMAWETWIQVLLYSNFDLEFGGGGGRSSSILRILRVFRLSRVARTARLLHSAPELLILVRGMFLAMRSVVTVLGLLALVIYIFAIIFVELLGGLELGKGRFEHVPQAMNFLLIQVVCGFEADVLRTLLSSDDQGWCYYTLLLVFYTLASLTMMNMLIGILCDVVSTVANVEKDDSFLREVDLQVRRLAKAIGIHCDSSSSISKREFEILVKDFDVAQSLHELGVDVIGIADFAAFIFEDCDEMPYSDFLQMVIQFRGAKGATIKDMMDMRKYISMEVSALNKKSIEHIGPKCSHLKHNSI